MVFSLAWRMTGDRGLAEELAQDVLLELDRNLRKLSSAEHARFWLRQVTLHRVADALRRRRTNAASLGSDLWEELEERHVLVEPFELEDESPLATVKSQLQRGLKLLRLRAGESLKEYVRGT